MSLLSKSYSPHFSLCHSLWESRVCGAHCWLSSWHLFPSLIPIWSSVFPGTPTPLHVLFRILLFVYFGFLLYSRLNAEASKGCKAQQGLVHITPTLSPLALSTPFHISSPLPSASLLFLEYGGQFPTLPPSISLNKTCEDPDPVEHFSLNLSFFFLFLHTERTFQ